MRDSAALDLKSPARSQTHLARHTMSIATAPAKSGGVAEDRLWTIDDLARHFSVSTSAVLRWRKRGILPRALKIGKRPLWPESVVKEFIAAGRKGKAAEEGVRAE